jgi:vacuolar-type H+-ATPase catalytic subunit A/Vma1
MKDINGYEGLYAVDENGNVFSFKCGKYRKLKPGLNNKGYHIVFLYKDRKGKTHKVHRLVAMTFLDDYSEDLQVDHIDGCRINNQISNLRIVTNQQNQWNRTKAKGYYWDKIAEKWKSQIALNSKIKHLGYFDTEAEARDSYLAAKKIYHII